MIALLDAHALLWALTSDPRLSGEARAVIQDPANTVLVSAATAWELSIKVASGKLRLSGSLLEDVEATGFGWLPITPADAIAAAGLPPHHRDPFDRMLVAQSRRLDAVLVTRDPAITAYGIRVLAA
jgi:PIN domain nuclease of toxin-antitoxin system